MQDVIKKLIVYKDPWSSFRLSKFGVNFDQLIGDLPYFISDSNQRINPALQTLENALSNPNFKLEVII